MREWEIKELLCDIGRRVYQREFVAANDGNFSVRLPDNTILATPTLVSKGYMTPEDIIKIDMDGNVIEGRKKPTSETRMHIFVYKNRSDINAIVHAHPPYATAWAIVGEQLPKCVMPEVEVLIGEIPITEYAPPGSQALAESLKTFIEKHYVFLLSNHGVLATGRDLMEAHFRMEIVEHYCKILMLAKQIGQIRKLSPEQMRHIFDIKKDIGVSDSRLNCENCGFCSAEPLQKTDTNIGKNEISCDNTQLIEQITNSIISHLYHK